MTIATSRPGLTLRRIDGSDAAELLRLVRKNRAHLTAFGDYGDLAKANLTGIQAMLETDLASKYPFAVVHDGMIIGRVDLIPVDPPNYAIGYWLAEAATGQGYAAASVNALIEYARIHLGASDIYAGVTHGNVKSATLLERAGFRRAADFDTYARFHLHLIAPE